MEPEIPQTEPVFIGIDAGSTSFKLTAINISGEIIHSSYKIHNGNPGAAESALIRIATVNGIHKYRAICATGSGRKIAGKIAGADFIKNEITATWRAVSQQFPDAATIIEIGGQDSKLITMENGEITSFKLNSVCAAGTGSFLQQQASRLGMPIEELSSQSLSAKEKARFTGRCTVFAETEMINLQQRGYPIESIAAGLSDAICENYLKDLSPGMKLQAPFVFCGGVAALDSVLNAFSERLGSVMLRPSFYKTAAAYGAALLAKDLCSATHDKDLIIPEPLPLSLENACGQTDCLMCGKCTRLIGSNQ